MTIFLCNSLADAVALEARACAYVNENGLARCGSWSAIYTDGSQYGFLWQDLLVPCFSEVELGTVRTEDSVSYGNVIEVADWTQYEPPAPDPIAA